MTRRHAVAPGWLALMMVMLATVPGRPPAADEQADDLIRMYVGEIRILKLKPIERVAVGNSKLISTSVLSNGQLVLVGEGEGVTSLHLWLKDGSERDYTVAIGGGVAKRGGKEVAELLSDIPGIRVREVGERIVLTGTVDPRWTPVIETVKGEYEGVLDLTQKSEPILPGDKMVFMNVKITEFNTSKLKDLGIEWTNPIAGPAAGVAVDAFNNGKFRVNGGAAIEGSLNPLDASTALGFFGIATEITSRLNFLVSSGDALLLAEPTLSARSGGEAEFLSGGELPIPTTGSLGQTNVEFKEFGIKLRISPVVDPRDNILAHVSTEVSSVDQSIAVQGIPGFATRKTETDISMSAGDTLVISGLLNQDTAEDVSKLWPFGDIPVLGELFKSTNFRNRKSELVIFVTPTVVDARSEANQARLQRRQQMLERFREAIGDEDLQLLD